MKNSSSVNDAMNTDVDFNINAGNYDPSSVDSDEVINAVFCIDISGSVGSYVDELNKSFKNSFQNISNLEK